MQEVLFSVLIANYNNASFLQEAIDSVFNQSYSNWEVIIVDDKSTDGSCLVYDKYKEDKRFHIFFNEKNSGCGYTKRRCVELSHGALCGFLDSDDALMDNAIETMVQQHADHPQCSLIYSTCYRYSGDRDAEMPIWDYIGEIPENEDYIVYRKSLVSHFVSFKKASYQKTLGVDPFLVSAVDRDLYCKLEEVGDLLYIDLPLYYYRVNNANSISIGTVEKDRQAHYYSVYSDLNTICRRMGGPLYNRNREKYLDNMRILMRIYCQSNLFTWRRFAYYCFYYVKGRGFSLHAFSHILKLFRDL